MTMMHGGTLQRCLRCAPSSWGNARWARNVQAISNVGSPCWRSEGLQHDRDGQQARIVTTHHSHCDGLLDYLAQLRKHPSIKTITPAHIRRTRSRAEHFSFDVRGRVQSGNGYRAVARNGSSAQDVFVVTALSADELSRHVEWAYDRAGLHIPPKKVGRSTGKRQSKRAGHARRPRSAGGSKAAAARRDQETVYTRSQDTSTHNIPRNSVAADTDTWLHLIADEQE